MRILTEFGKFWYDLLVGDDWKIAAAVVVALTVSAILLTSTGASDHVVAVVGGTLVVVAFCFSLVMGIRQKE